MAKKRQYGNRAVIRVPWENNSTLQQKMAAARKAALRDEYGCLIWPCARQRGRQYEEPRGYGRLREPQYGMWLAHRAEWFVHYGRLSKTEVIHHACGRGTRGCFALEHLQSIKPSNNTAESYERMSLRRQLAALEVERMELESQVLTLRSLLSARGDAFDDGEWDL